MTSGYDPNYFAALFEIEDRHFWFSARNLALTSILHSITPRFADGYRVLEVGCGTGNTLRMLESACARAGLIIGMDLFFEGLQFARRRSHVPLVRGSMEGAPFAEPFELVAMFDVLEHIEDDEAALRRARTLVKPGGSLVVTVPAGKALWSRFDEEAHHCRRYERDELGVRLTAAGFRVEYLTHFMMTLYPITRAARSLSEAANRVREWMHLEQRSAVLTDIKVRPMANALLGLALRPEIPMLRKRRRLAFGTSLLAVASPADQP